MERACQLLEVERIATALLVEHAGIGGGDCLTEKLSSLVDAEGAEFDLAERSRTLRPCERGR
jgi:hypothetical protein